MNDRLLIRIKADGALSWLDGRGCTRGDGTPPPAVLSSATQILVLVPGDDVLLIHAGLPPSSPARLAQVLPYALEDQVLDDVESLHFVAGPRREDGQHAVAVVARERMQVWQDVLGAAGIAADRIVPDFLAVPLDGRKACALLDGEHCLVRLAADKGFACVLEQLPNWLETGLDLDLIPVEASGKRLVPSGFDWQVLRPMAALDALYAGAELDSGLNLLSGAFAPQHRRAPQRRLWRVAAILAGVAIVVGLAGQLTSVLRLQAANSEVEKAIEQHYADLFPDSPPVPDPVARVRSELARLGGVSQDQGLLGVLSQAAPILASHDFRLDVLGMEYRNNTLELSVHSTSLSNLDQLRERLATMPGMQVELTAATPGADGVQGRISMTGKGT